MTKRKGKTGKKAPPGALAGAEPLPAPDQERDRGADWPVGQGGAEGSTDRPDFYRELGLKEHGAVGEKVMNEPPGPPREGPAREKFAAPPGGLSSAEASAAYASGESPGGTHGGPSRPDPGPEHPRPRYEEPEERGAAARHRGGPAKVPETRRGS